jgi:hypothetical protein
LTGRRAPSAIAEMGGVHAAVRHSGFQSLLYPGLETLVARFS